MSSKPVPVEEDELVAALRAHRRKAMNLKTYENIGKSQTPDGPGLVKLYDLVMAILGVCPAANISKDQWRRVALQLNRDKRLNTTELTIEAGLARGLRGGGLSSTISGACEIRALSSKRH